MLPCRSVARDTAVKRPIGPLENPGDAAYTYTSMYRPACALAAASWTTTADLTRLAVVRSTGSLANAKKYCGHVAAYLAWTHEQGIAMVAEQAFDLDTIERYIAVGMTGAKESTRGTRRAILRRVARQASPTLRVQPLPEPIRYRRVRPPYPAAEVAALLRLARAQPTPSRRQMLSGVLALGLGCGLDSRDLAWVRGIDVERRASGAVLVTVSGGSRPRQVTALADYEDLLWQTAGHRGEKLVIGGFLRGRRNVTRGPFDNIVGGDDFPRLEPARLRSTWLVTHLRLRTPLPVLMTAAGLSTVRPLEDLLGYAGDEVDSQAALRGPTE